MDLAHNSGLSHTFDRFITLQQMKLGDISQKNIASYISGTFGFNEHFQQSMREYGSTNSFTNIITSSFRIPRCQGSAPIELMHIYLAPNLTSIIISMKRPNFYLTTGRGFHSNDTRAVVAEKGSSILPPAYAPIWVRVFKPWKNVLVNASLWYIYLQQEFVYNGDGGDVAFNGNTRRAGFDLSGRYQPAGSVYIDLDLNYAHGRTHR